MANKAYYEENRGKIKQYQKAYYEENKEKILENNRKQGSKKVQCLCGAVISSRYKKKHKDTSGHILKCITLRIDPQKAAFRDLSEEHQEYVSSLA